MPLENVVVLSSSHPSNTWFIRAVQEIFPLRAVIRVVGAAPCSRKKRKNATLSRVFQSLERRLFYERFYNRHDDRVAELLGAEHLQPPSDVENFELSAERINSASTADLIRELETDLLVVHSAPLLTREVFSVPREGAINVHYGIAPQYRGENTLFWPLYRRDYANIGITIHRISAGIDAGEILCQGFPDLEPQDSESLLNAKCTRLAARLVGQLLHTWEPGIQGMKQIGRGRNFNRRDRRLWHDALYSFRRIALREQLPQQAERCEFYLSGRDAGHLKCEPTAV